MIEAVIWDFGGVITSSPFEAFARFKTNLAASLAWYREWLAGRVPLEGENLGELADAVEEAELKLFSTEDDGIAADHLIGAAVQRRAVVGLQPPDEERAPGTGAPVHGFCRLPRRQQDSGAQRAIDAACRSRSAVR